MAFTAGPLMRPRCERNPKMATARVPTQRPDTNQRLPKTCKISLANSSRYIHLGSKRPLSEINRVNADRGAPFMDPVFPLGCLSDQEKDPRVNSGHSTTASASISTLWSPIRSATTTRVFTGLMSPKTRPCACDTARTSSASVRYIRVLMT